MIGHIMTGLDVFCFGCNIIGAMESTSKTNINEINQNPIIPFCVISYQQLQEEPEQYRSIKFHGHLYRR